MPLPQPNLDDKNFVTLVDEATKLIPRQSPEWTDHNRHDPGITFIELFAWLTEMQHFYLNSVSAESRLKFLKLLGLRPTDPQRARVDVTFSLDPAAVKNAPALNIYVPRGTKLATADDLIFETEESINVLPFAVGKVLSQTRGGYRDHTDANRLDGLSFDAFGETAAAGSRLYLGFAQEFPPDQPITLSVELAEDYAVAHGTHGDEPPDFTPSARIVWEYQNKFGEWMPLDVLAEIEAAVAALGAERLSGDDCFKAKGQLLTILQLTANFNRLPQRARDYIERALDEANSPESFQKSLDAAAFLRLKNDETLMLSQSGRVTLDPPADAGKFPIRPFSDELYWLRASVRQEGYELPPRIDYIGLNMVKAVQHDTLSEVVSFSGTGQPEQTFEARSYLAIYGQNIVQVREPDGRWKDWRLMGERRSLLNFSGANDTQYLLAKDADAGRVEISFGDGKRGKVPPEGTDNIRLISFLPDFNEQRMLGESTGMPRQSFALDRLPPVAESLLVQVEEQIAVEPFITETTDVSCLLHFTRTIPGRVQANVPFEVRITLEARQELCDINLREMLNGNLRFEMKQTLHNDFRMVDEAEVNLHIKRVRAGELVERTYSVVATTRRGGSIEGHIVVSLAHDCPTVIKIAPVSVVAVGDRYAETRWRDWTRVDDFDASGPSDAHCVLDACAGRISFGDGIHGDIPQASPQENRKNIRLISYQAGGGERGNVVAGTIKRIARPFQIELSADWRNLLVLNEEAATGGKGREEIGETEARARRDLKTQYQAVTSADYETLTLSTPGLRVARARAIPLYTPGMVGYPQVHAPASVTVVVVPYSTLLKPVPSEGFLQTVCRHLDRHRLITTQVHVVAPEYVRVNVQATVLLTTGFDHALASERIQDALNRFLRPLPAEDDARSTGWPFGRTVYKSEVYQLIENVEGVDCVEKVVLVAEGVGIARTPEGNVLIPPQSLVYPGEHQVEIVTPTVDCRS
jgi:predicted phage baseplate assembly protein